MKFAIGNLTVLALLAGCASGSDGNPNEQPYAGEPGGTVAVAPTPPPAPLYDPIAQAAPFQDMRAGRPVTPPPPANRPLQ